MRKTITAVAIGIAVLLGACDRASDAARNYYSEVKSVNKLVLAQMTISKMATVDDIKLEDADGARQTAAAVIDAVKIGNRKAAYSYDTYLRAYVDLTGLQPEDVVVATWAYARTTIASPACALR